MSETVTAAGRRGPAVSWKTVLAALGIVTLYVAMRLPGIAVPLDRDEGTFGLMGQVINRGGLPYHDAIDHKPPAAFYLNALALHFVPPTAEGIHIFVLLYNLLTLVCVFLLAKALFRSVAAALWCAFGYAVFSASPAIQGFTASTEMYSLLPGVVSLLLAVLWAERRRTSLALLSGIAGAIACWTKQTAFTSVLFAFLFLCVAGYSRRDEASASRRWPDVLAGPAWWLGGATFFSAAVALWFYAHGIYQEFVYWCFTYELSYARVPLSETLQTIPHRLTAIGRGDGILAVAGLAVTFWSLDQGKRHGYFLLGFLGLSFLGTIPGYSFRHYFVQLAPAVALAGGYAIFVLLARVRTPAARTALAALFIVLIPGVSVAANRSYFLNDDPDDISRNFFGDNPFPESPLLATYLAGATRESDRVLIVGSEPQILFYAQRQSPSPFIMFYPLTDANPHYRDFQAKLWADVQRTPPKYILSVENIATSFIWDDQADSGILDTLNDYIRANYTRERRMPVGEAKHWMGANERLADNEDPVVDVYRRNDQAAGPPK